MFTRHIIPRLLESLADSPVVLLHGARQTGKSTLIQHLAATGHPAQYFTFDDPAALMTAQTDPVGFLAGLRGPVALDEVQRAPGLFLPLKAQVDRDRRPGRFLLTGSANVLLVPRLSESLAGRMEILPLWPLSQGEIEGHREGFVDAMFGKSLPPPPSKAAGAHLLERVLRGGYPEAHARAAAARRRAWFNSYITTILQRDIRDLAQIEAVGSVPRLLALLASRTGSLMNYADLSRSLDMPQSTLKRYIALLEATFLIHPLPPWSSNLGKRLVKSAKLYLADTGLAASLLGQVDAASLKASDLLGPLVENFVVMELRKQVAWSDIQPGLFHYRTLGNDEVDVVLESPDGRLVGIEVKAGSTISSGDVKGLRSLAEHTGKRFVRGIVLYGGREVVPLGASLHAMPLDVLWRF